MGNRVGAISDGLIKHGIAKLRDVLGSALITTPPGTSAGTTTGGMETQTLLKTEREEWPAGKDEPFYKIKCENNEDGKRELSPRNPENEKDNMGCNKIDESCVVESPSIDKVSRNV